MKVFCAILKINRNTWLFMQIFIAIRVQIISLKLMFSSIIWYFPLNCEVSRIFKILFNDNPLKYWCMIISPVQNQMKMKNTRCAYAICVLWTSLMRVNTISTQKNDRLDQADALFQHRGILPPTLQYRVYKTLIKP